MDAARSPTIRSRLTLLVIAAIIPASLLAAALISYNYHEERTRLERDAVATSRALMQAIDRELNSVKIAAQVLSTSPYLQKGDLSAFYDQAKSVVELRIGNNVVVTDATGQQVLNTIKPVGEPLPGHGNLDQSHLEQLREVFEKRRPVISDLFIGGVLRQPITSVDVPVVHDGQVVYELGVVILPDRFSNLLRDQHLPPGWIATVFDSSGTIAARTHEMDRFVGKKGSPELIKRMSEVSEGALPTITLEGIPVLAAFSRSSVSNWAVAIGIPAASLAEQLWGSLIWLIIGSAVLLLISVWLAWGIGGQISHSIYGLIAPALAVGMGKLVTVPSLRLKEADEVGQALMRASRMLLDAEHRANHDPLTGLPNRELFDEVAQQQLDVCRKEGSSLAILYVDLDDFKTVNDGFGHAVGDELLCAVAARLRNAIRGADFVARLGGDEFAVLLTRTRPDAAATVAGNLVDVLAQPYAIGALTVRMSASIGVAGYPTSGVSIASLLASADAAMYKAKKAGKQRAAVAERHDVLRLAT